MKSMVQWMLSLAMAVVLSGAVWAAEQTMCPVMTGQKINKQLFVDFEGKRIYVCCPVCQAAVKADPAKFVAQLEKEGVTLDKTPAVAAPAGK